MKISKLIKLLEVVMQEHGDFDVVMSSDPEGNQFGRVHEALVDEAKKQIIIYPSGMSIDL